MFSNEFMQVALSAAKTSFLKGEIPVGAILVDPQTNKIITQNHNLVEQKQDPTAHAEILAIQAACKSLSSKSLAGLDLYVTLQPCAMCLQAAIYAKIRRIYFGAFDPAIVLQLPKSTNHTLEIYGGICEISCKELLDNFFSSKR